MRRIPATVLSNILGRCNWKGGDLFASTMLPLDDELQKALIKLVEKIYEGEDSADYRQWALGELAGVEDGNDTE